jgi:hypothetical protein
MGGTKTRTLEVGREDVGDFRLVFGDQHQRLIRERCKEWFSHGLLGGCTVFQQRIE